MKRILALILALLILTLTGCGGAAGTETGEALPGVSASQEAVDAEGTNLEVYCFSAGKADAILLTTENSTVLIDCGEKGFGKDILAHLETRGIDYIDCLIITHFDQDHVGGAAKVINNISVGTVLQSNCPKDSEEYEKYVTALTNAGLEPVTVRETMEIVLDGVRYMIDPPKSDDYDQDDSNNSSLIVTVYNGTNVLLFTGDAQTERLEEYLESETVDCDFLKVPHHGGEDELMDDLIAVVQPEYAVITCSDEEPEAESTMQALDAQHVETYLTRQGAVLIKSNGSALTVEYTS